MFGDFEDLETGEKVEGEEEKEEEDEDEDEEEKLKEKKEKLKSQFDAEFDQSKEGDSTYLDELKKEVEIQSKVRRKNDEFPRNFSFSSVESFRIRRYAR